LHNRPRDNSPYLFLFPSVLILLGLTIYPILYALNLSFYKWAVTSGAAPNFVGLANYADLMNSSEFFNALTNTLIFTGASVGLSFVTGLMLALLLNSEIKGSGIYQSFLMIPTIITPIVVGMSFRFLYNFDIGLINYFLEVIHLPKQAWLGTPSLALPALILVDIWEWTPFMALVLLAGLQSLPQPPFEAADIDGASIVQKFRYITLPMLGQAIAVALLIRTMDAFRWFDTIYAMTRGGPGDATETLSVFAWKYGFLYFDMGYATAAALLMLFMIEFFCWAYLRLSFKPR
jgi:multiple sugar transport system permease protein